MNADQCGTDWSGSEDDEEESINNDIIFNNFKCLFYLKLKESIEKDVH